MDLWFKEVKGKVRQFWEKRQHGIVSAALALFLVGSGVYMMMSPQFGPLQNKVRHLLDWEVEAYAVMVGNEQVAVVESEEVAEKAWNDAVSVLNSGDIKYHFDSGYQTVQTTAKPSEFADQAGLEDPFEQYLSENLQNYSVTGYTLNVGDFSFVFRTIDEILELFQRLAQNCLGEAYSVACTGIRDGQPIFDIQEEPMGGAKALTITTPEQTEEEGSTLLGVKLPYEVVYQMIYTREDDLITVDEAYEQCIQNRVVERTYTVVAGDSLNRIASKNELSLTELLALNPEYTINSVIHAGDVFRVQASETNVIVYRVMREIYERYDDPPVEYEYDSKKYTNYSSVIKEGKPALVKVEDVVYYNGTTEAGREEISVETLEEAEVKVVLRGTKPLPQFIWPTQGTVTSEFKMRWGRMHKGIDIANRYGTPIYASASGKVIRAGWYSTYGQCVMIDHQNGFVTVYAHNSSINVKVGQWVTQGELIAKMGSTGNSTGNHCHFEIRHNGSCINPRKYLK